MNSEIQSYYDERRAFMGTNKYLRNLRTLDKNIAIKYLKLSGGSRPIKVKLPWGEFNGVLPEHVTSTIWKYGCFDPSVGCIISKIVKPGDTVFDVGAHYGYFSQMCSAIVGEAGEVHSFEATPSTAKQLELNASFSINKNITVVDSAVGAEECEMQFNDFGLINSSLNSVGAARTRKISSNLVNVNCITLDDYVKSKGIVKVDFMKLDVESSEQLVLQGAFDLFRNHYPAAAVELGATNEKEQNNMRFIHSYFQDFGYDKFEVRGDKLIRQDIKEFTNEYANCLFVKPNK